MYGRAETFTWSPSAGELFINPRVHEGIWRTVYPSPGPHTVDPSGAPPESTGVNCCVPTKGRISASSSASLDSSYTHVPDVGHHHRSSQSHERCCQYHSDRGGFRLSGHGTRSSKRLQFSYRTSNQIPVIGEAVSFGFGWLKLGLRLLTVVRKGGC